MEQNHLTEGPIVPSLFKLALPIVFANLLQTAYQLIDTFWVGRVGALAVAAVSLSFPIIFLMISLGAGLSIAGAILIAQYKGKGDQKSVDHIGMQTLTSMVVVSATISVVGYYLTPWLIGLMTHDTSLFADAVSYLQISFIGMVFVFGFAVYQSLMRGVGDVKTPMYIVLGTVILNFFLDPLFILGYGPIPAMGVAGAAMATIFTQSIAAFIGVGMLFWGRGNRIRLHMRDLAPDWKLLSRMNRLGFPASIAQSTRALGLMAMAFIVATFSDNVIAAYGVGARILSFIIVPALGMSMATSTMVGQNIGAGKKERALETARVSGRVSFWVLSAAGVLIFLFAKPISAFFIPGDPTVIGMSATFIQIMALTYGFLGWQQAYYGAFRGAGDTAITMILSVLTLWVLRFPFALILSKFTSVGFIGIWWAFPVSNVAGGVLTWLFFIKGRWMRLSVADEGHALAESVSEEIMIEEGMD